MLWKNTLLFCFKLSVRVKFAAVSFSADEMDDFPSREQKHSFDKILKRKTISFP